MPDTTMYDSTYISHKDYCNWFTDLWGTGNDPDDGCFNNCDEGELTKLSEENEICTECLAEGDDACDQWLGDEDDEGVQDDGPPECLSGCTGIEGVDPEGDPETFCTWLTDTDISSCSSGCDEEVTADITAMIDLCTDCISEGNCDEVELSTDEKNLLLPEAFSLHPVYPNPFNPTTDIGFSLELAGPVSISVYDVTGRQIETIVNNEFRNAGSHIINWNGSPFPSGIYFIYLQAGKQIDIQKVTLLK